MRLPEYPGYGTICRSPYGNLWVRTGCDEEHPWNPADSTGMCIDDGYVREKGLDVGITTLVTLSTGEKIANPKHEKKDRAKLAKAQRNMARKQKGSNNRAKARLKVAKVYDCAAGEEQR